MKFVLLFYISLFAFSLVGQELSFFEIISPKEVEIYFSAEGQICDREEAKYIRVCGFDSNYVGYCGVVKDYTQERRLVYESNYLNGLLNGPVKYYYPNDSLKYEGYFKNSQRDSIWTFYYKNGVLEKELTYENGIPSFDKFYKKNGDPVFLDGNGKYKGRIFIANQVEEYFLKGTVVDGKQDGRWLAYGQGVLKCEIIFDNGKLLNKPIVTSDLLGFNIHNNFDLFRFIARPVFKHGLKYNMDSIRCGITEVAAIKMMDYFGIESNKLNIPSFLCLVQFKIDKNNSVSNVKCFSTHKEMEIACKNYYETFEDFKNIGKSPSYMHSIIYIPIIVLNKKVNLPYFSIQMENKTIY